MSTIIFVCKFLKHDVRLYVYVHMSCKSIRLEKCPWVHVVVTSTTQHKCIPKFDCVGAYQNKVKTFMKLHNKSHQSCFQKGN